MNIDNLKCFILVAENLSFARAAEALYISQPAVTKQINALERELGVTLFVRSTRHVELTAAGMSFYKDAKDIVATAQMAINRAQRQNVMSDTVRIGLSNYIALFYLTDALERLHNSYPDIHPNIQVFSYKVVLNLFLENKLDILFYYKENMTPKADTTFLRLEKDHFVCLIPVGQTLAQKEKISVTDLENERVIVCNPLNAPLSTASFQQKLINVHSADNVLYCDSIEIAHSMVSARLGIAILPSILTMKSPKYNIVPIDDTSELSFGAFYNKRNTNTAFKNFLKILKEK